MNDGTRTVTNPLFNAAVTGGSIEEFSQNAILLPAKKKAPASTLDITQDQLLSTIVPRRSSENIELPPYSNIEEQQQQQKQIDPEYLRSDISEYSQNQVDNFESTTLSTTQKGPNFSSVFSSFSNILNLKSKNVPSTTQEEQVIQAPAGIDSFINQGSCSIEPVPLFPTVAPVSQPVVTTNKGPVNVFRRSGLKRPTYAKVPGLSNRASPQVNLLPPQNIPPLPFQPSVDLLAPQTTTYLAPRAPENLQTPKLPPTISCPLSQNSENHVPPLVSSVFQAVEVTPVTSGFSQPEPAAPPPPPPPPPQSILESTPATNSSIPVWSACPQQFIPPSTPVISTSSGVADFSQPFSHCTTLNKGPLSSQNLPNQFKPISPPRPSLNVSSQIPQPLSTVSLQPVSQSLQSIKTPTLFTISPSHHQSPVMDSIPASEALPTDNLNTPDSYTANDNSSETNIAVNQVYRPVYHHWFFQKEIESKKLWQPFSMVDSLLLEQAFNSNDLDPDKVIPTDGGRYDVNILRRQRIPAYWKGTHSEVRRCSWFHKSSPDGRLVPYEENVATKLEEEFKMAFELNHWHRKVHLANGETVIIHGPDVLVLFPPSQTPNDWGTTPNQTRPRVVKRGMDEFDIDEGEPSHVDHILFMVHGIGSVCDFKFRSVEEVVDEFRNIALQLVQSHYRTSCEKGVIHRVEVLPISWHSKLHSDETGIDKQLKGITLESIPKLRDFTNDTLLDILFYTSPVYCQTIVSTVGNELNRVYDLFKQRNPTFNGGVSLAGHSLGSLILFDLLCHQHPHHEESEEETEEVLKDDLFPSKKESKTAPAPPPPQRKISRRISYMMGTVGTGQPQIYYPHLNFEPKTFFALGSPIGMFVIIRGLDTLGENFSLPTCPAFFNIFHPYDPIAYRIESLIRPELRELKPVLIPHHKGRKRMHLELKETMARVGADLKQKVIDSMKSTWNSFYQLAVFHKPDEPSIEEVQKAFQEELEMKSGVLEEPVQEVTDIPLGGLNKGRRVDYVLQEAPFEFINEYIFALTSHVCYWESEDTILLMLKEIYSSMGFKTDNQIPQQTMTIERPPPSTSVSSITSSNTIGIDPTQPIQVKSNLQPPPTMGFIRKT